MDLAMALAYEKIERICGHRSRSGWGVEAAPFCCNSFSVNSRNPGGLVTTICSEKVSPRELCVLSSIGAMSNTGYGVER